LKKTERVRKRRVWEKYTS